MKLRAMMSTVAMAALVVSTSASAASVRPGSSATVGKAVKARASAEPGKQELAGGGFVVAAIAAAAVIAGIIIISNDDNGSN